MDINRDLEQTDAAAERRRSNSNLHLVKSDVKGRLNSLGLESLNRNLLVDRRFSAAAARGEFVTGDSTLHHTYNISKEEIKYSSRNRDSQNESPGGFAETL